MNTRSSSSPRRPGLLRRLTLAGVLLAIFASGFGGSFTCKSEQGSVDYTDTDTRNR